MCQSLGPLRSKSLLALHSITGCDQTSAFANRGKKTAWAVWEVYGEVTPALHDPSSSPSKKVVGGVGLMPQIERFIECSTVNGVRKDLFTRKGRSLESIPTTSASLLQYMKWSAYQAEFQWGQSLVTSPPQPCPDDWGLVKDHCRLGNHAGLFCHQHLRYARSS